MDENHMTGPDGVVYEAVDTNTYRGGLVCDVCAVYKTALCSLDSCASLLRRDRRSIYWVGVAAEPDPNPL